MVGNPLIFITFFLLALVVTPLSIAVSRQFGIIDEPGGRKTHNKSTPRGAGVVIWLGYMLFSLFFPDSGNGLRLISTAATVIFIFGYMDDMRPLPATWRLCVHGLCSAVVVAFLPVTPVFKLILFLWITGSTSAYNLIDGINGLSLILFALTVILGLFLFGQYWWAALLGLAAGVLPWNYPVARTFLGDGGSTLIGFICMSQFSSELASYSTEMSIAGFLFVLLLIGGVPVIDTLYSIFRRLLAGVSPFLPDRGHFHHILCDRGFPVVVVLLVLGILHSFLLLGAVVILGHPLPFHGVM